MAVPEGPTDKRYTGNGVTKIFTIPFLLLAATDLDVYIDGIEISSGFAITNVGNPTSTITFAVAPVDQADIYLQLNVPFERLNDYQENGDFLSTTVNRDFDRIWQALKQLLRWSARSLRLGNFEVDGAGWYRAKGNGVRDLHDPVEAQDASTKVWTQRYVGEVVDGMTGNPNLASNVFYLGPDGLPYTVQDMSQAIGAGMVGFGDSLYYAANTVGDALKNIKKHAVFVEPLGGALSDSANINAAAASVGSRGDLFFSGSTYNINETVTVPENQAWKGTGGQRGTTFLKTANCDMVVVLSLGAISDINLQGAGATYSGKGIRIPSGFSQSIERCRSVDMGGEPLYFDNNAGGGANVSTFEGYPTDPTAFAGIAVAGDTGPHPRFFRGIWLSGANFALGPGAGNGGSMIGFYIRNLKLDPGSTLFHFGMGRVAAINDDIPLQGFDHTFDGVAFSGTVILRNAQGINVGSSCTVSTLIQDPATAQYNSVFVQRRSYPVLWTQTSAAPAIGNGSLVGNFVRAGHLCLVELAMTAGSSTTFGDSGSAWQFSLPFPGHASIDQRGFPVRIYDASAAVDFVAWASIGANSQIMTITTGAQTVRAGQPMVWASGDLLQASFLYMTR